MHVTKIKIKQDRVFVEYDKVVVVNKENLVNKYSIDSPEQPVGAFKEAFQKMDFFLIELCELCDKPADVPTMCEDVTITGLSFKYSEGELSSAIITGTKALAYSNSPLVLNTPNKSVCVDEFDRMKHLTDPCIAGLSAVLRYAGDYVNGKRLQIEMDLRDDEMPVKKDNDSNAGKGDETVQSARLEPKEAKSTGSGIADISREPVKTADDMAEAEWKLHPHNPDSPNFIGDAAIQQIGQFDDSEDVKDSETLEEPPL